MQELDDIALLREYVEHDSEQAFATLVTRHIDRVYSVALRHTRNPHQAEEITQAVFVILARKSSQLRKGVILEGWLYQTARLTAVTFIRSEARRARREQEAHMETEPNENESEAWSQIAPLLDTALAGLSEADRNAVVMRFFYGKSLKEIGTTLGSSEDTARMRVNRAIEKLQRFFIKRGVTSTAAMIIGAISVNSVQAAPAVLAKSITAVAVTKGVTAGASTSTLIEGALKIMAWTKMKSAVVAVAVLAVGATTAVVVQQQINSRENKPAAPMVSADTEQLAFAGYATPEATIRTIMWATSRGDFAAFLECLTPEGKLKHQQQWQGRTRDELIAEGKQQFATLRDVKIVDQTSVGDNRVIVTLHFAGNGKTEKITFVKIGQDWKMAK